MAIETRRCTALHHSNTQHASTPNTHAAAECIDRAGACSRRAIVARLALDDGERPQDTHATSFSHFPSLDGPALWSAIESAAEQASIGVYVAHIDARPPCILYVNPRAAEIAGRPAAELVGQAPWSILRAEDKPVVQEVIGRPAGAPPMSLELVVERPDGRHVPIVLAATRIHTASGMLSFGYFRDVSSERETTAALRRSEARFQFLVETAPDGVVILKHGKIVFINPKAAQLLGVDSVAAIGRSVMEFLPPADAASAGERIGRMLRDGVEFPPSEYGVLADRDRIVEIKSTVCEWDGATAVLAFARDVTERKAIQRRLVEADRLAALGTLAAGVAHEINNPLTYAQLSAQRIGRLVDGLGLPPAVLATLRGHLGDIDHGITRVASITQTLRSFVRIDDEGSGPVDLEAVVTHALKMVDNDLRHVARLVRETAVVPVVLGNPSRLEQVFVNILVNAIKSLPPQPAKPHEIHVVITHAGERVTVAISDTGRGIPAAARGRIFDPFFTTRGVGEGMGLGLSVSKTIVDSFGGEIEVDSVEDVGTTVRVHLRVHRPTTTSPPITPATHSPLESARMRVLVVDDETQICNVLARILSHEHDVTTAISGGAALAAIAQVDFDLILLDVMMPGSSGLDVLRRITAEHAGLEQRVVFMSGGAFGPDVAGELDALPNPRLAKPFKIEQVLELVATYAR